MPHKISRSDHHSCPLTTVNPTLRVSGLNSINHPLSHQQQWLEVKAQQSVSCTCHLHQVQDLTPIHSLSALSYHTVTSVRTGNATLLICIPRAPSTQAHSRHSINSCQINECGTLKKDASLSRLLHIAQAFKDSI